MRTRLGWTLLLGLILAGCAGESLPDRAGGVLDRGSDAVRKAVEPQPQPSDRDGEVAVP